MSFGMKHMRHSCSKWMSCRPMVIIWWPFGYESVGSSVWHLRFCEILQYSAYMFFGIYVTDMHTKQIEAVYCAGQGACELDARSHKSPWRWDWDEVSCECLHVSRCLTMFLCLFDFVVVCSVLSSGSISIDITDNLNCVQTCSWIGSCS